MILPRIHFMLLSSLALGLATSATTPYSSAHAISAASCDDTPHFTYEELYKLLTDFWDSFLYPADVAQAKVVNSTIFSEDVQGRMDATRTFTGRELNTEYLFGLFANLATSSGVSLLGVPISYEILKFSANEYVSSAATRVMFNLTSLNIIIPIEIDTWTTWNSLGQLTQYDGVFKYWQWLQDFVIEQA